MRMNIEFWGAARTVTGSMHLVEANGRRILLDCGIYHGRRKKAYERNKNLPFDAESIDAVILSHAHIDHSGNLPTLVRSGYKGEIYSTSATRDLAAHMLLDSAHIQESDARRENRYRQKAGKTLFEPLYVEDDAIETLKRFITIPYEQPHQVFPGIQVSFIEAGHMLGSASVALDVDEVGQTRRLVFSGDIGRKGIPILRDPRTFANADYVIMESTYGSRDHDRTEESQDYLYQTVKRCREKGGKLLIPSFAVGRTQELAYRLNLMWEAGEMPPVDVYVDTPLGVKATDVYKLHPECYDAQMLRQMQIEKDGDPLGFERLTYTRSADESRALNELDGAAIIIAPSGMCTGGRIMHHLIHHGGKTDTTIFFVGYQANGTTGRKILEGAKKVRIYGKEYPIRAKIRKGASYSAHAGRKELIDWAETVLDKGSPKRFFLVHGEEDAARALAGELKGRGFPSVEVPERGSRYEL